MKKILTIGTIGVIIFLFAENGSSNPIQWAGNGHWYERLDLSYGISWDNAKAAAEAQGGYLATITSYEEDYFAISNLIIPVQDAFPNRPRNGDWFPYWIGGYQEPNSSAPDVNWKWITGEIWSYENWYGSEPNDAGGPLGDGQEDIASEAENFLTYWTETNMNSGVLNYGWNDLRGDSGENRLGYFVEYDTNPTPIPEPCTMLLVGTGLVGVAELRRKFKI